MKSNITISITYSDRNPLNVPKPITLEFIGAVLRCSAPLLPWIIEDVTEIETDGPNISNYRRINQAIKRIEIAIESGVEQDRPGLLKAIEVLKEFKN